MDSTSRPWWKHPAVHWAAVIILRVTGILVFRGRRPAFLRAVRRVNKRFLNPLVLHLAGRRHWYAARLEHVGWRTGRRYATPVVAQPVHGGFAIPLPYPRTSTGGATCRRSAPASCNPDLVGALALLEAPF